MNLALDAVLNDCKVLFYSLEMSGEQVSQRMISCMDYLKCLRSHGEPLSYGAIIRQEMNEQQRLRIASMPIDKVVNNLIFVDAYEVTPSQVVARIKSEKRKSKNLTLVIIDYLTLLDLDSDSGNKDTRALMIGNATRKLKTVSKKAGVDIVAVCQLNRGVETRIDKRPVMSDLRESGRIEEDADVIIGNYWPYYYDKNHDPMDYEYIALKNRHGATGTSNILFAAENYAMTERLVNF
jgi:replicative DNA helicase